MTPLKLYYAPGACSMATHIVLREAGATFALERVDLSTHRLTDGRDFRELTPKGQVPLLETPDGDRLTEGPVVMQYVADGHDAPRLLPPAGTRERWRVLEWCNHLTSEVHKSFTPLFHGGFDDAATETLRAQLRRKLAFLDAQLAGRRHLTGEDFTIADAYLFVLLSWTVPVRLDIADLHHLRAFQRQVALRPAVKAAMIAEGLAA